MSSWVLKLIFLSISGSILASVLFMLKPLIQHKVSKAFSYYIWVIVLVRLVLPVAAPINAMDVLFNRPTVSAPQMAEAADVSAVVPDNSIRNDAQQIARDSIALPGEAHVAPTMPTSELAKTFNLWAFLKDNILWIWTFGVFVSLIWFVMAYLRFYRMIKRNNIVPLPADEAIFRFLCKNKNISLACNNYIQTPMLIGIFHPVIVVPRPAYAQNGMGQTLRNILHHELTHDKRKDLIYKWLVVLITSLHWFNPLMIFIRREISRACELSCDEAVIRTMSNSDKQLYGNTLLALSTNRILSSGILTTTLSDRKSELRERLISIMKYKKNKPCISILSVLFAIVLTSCGVALGSVTDQTEGAKNTDTDSTMSDTGVVEASASISSNIVIFKMQPSNETVTDFLSVLENLPKAYDNDICYNITPQSITDEFGFTVYKFAQSCASFLVFDDEIYPLGQWFGGYGVVSFAIADMNNDKFPELYFTYSWGSGLHRSHVGYFDSAKKVVVQFHYSKWDKDTVLVMDGNRLFAYTAALDIQSFVNIDLKEKEMVGEIVYSANEIAFHSIAVDT